MFMYIKESLVIVEQIPQAVREWDMRWILF